jgi:transcription elongation GreA/GreB family factor
MTLKEKIYSHYRQLLNEKILRQQQAIDSLRESAAGETKRTAGDKHETALAMLQAEQERLQVQLNELLAQKVALDKINPSLTAAVVAMGSLVTTNEGCFYISTSLGRAVVDGIAVTAISPQSPLGGLLLGLATGGKARLNSRVYAVEKVE